MKNDLLAVFVALGVRVGHRHGFPESSPIGGCIFVSALLTVFDLSLEAVLFMFIEKGLVNICMELGPRDNVPIGLCL